MATTTPKKVSTAVSAAATNGLLILTFANGKILTVDSAALSKEIYHAAAMHGLKQKLIDGAAIARDPETGRTATIDDKYAAVLDIYTRITDTDAPTWNKARAAGEAGGASSKGGVFITALMRMTSKSRDDINAWLEPLSKEQVAALRKNPRVVELMRLIQAERTDTSAVDTDALLDGLMEGAEHADDDGDSDGDERDPEDMNDGTGDPSRS